MCSELGSAAIRIQDVVGNESLEPQPHMLLYHVNLGWPLVDDGTTVDLPSQAVAARDAAAEEAVSAWRTVGRPRPDRGEQVLRHERPTGQTIEVVVSDPRLGLELALGFDTRQRPHLFI